MKIFFIQPNKERVLIGEANTQKEILDMVKADAKRKFVHLKELSIPPEGHACYTNKGDNIYPIAENYILEG